MSQGGGGACDGRRRRPNLLQGHTRGRRSHGTSRVGVGAARLWMSQWRAAVRLVTGGGDSSSAGAGAALSKLTVWIAERGRVAERGRGGHPTVSDVDCHS